MVEAMERIGKLLELPDLEDETKQQINKVIRDLLDRYMQPATQQQQSGIDPFKAVQDVQQKAKELLGGNTMNEWLNGVTDGERG